MKRATLYFVIALASLPTAQEAHAICPACMDVNTYGSDNVASTGKSMASVDSASSQISSGFVELTNTMKTEFVRVASAFDAMTSNITMTLDKNSQITQRMVDEYNRQNEQRAQTQFMMQTNQKFDDEYGEANLPVTTCENYSDAQNLQLAEASAEDLRAGLNEYLKDYVSASPTSEWRYNKYNIENSTAATESLSSSVLTSDQIQQSMDWVNLALDPVPVSPINPPTDEQINHLSPDRQKVLAEIQTSNLRSAAGKQAMVDQIMLKAPIVGEDESIQSVLEKKAYQALDPDSLQDLSNGSMSLNLRTLVQDMQFGNVIDYENLKETLNQTRMKAIALAQASDNSNEALRLREGVVEGTSQIE